MSEFVYFMTLGLPLSTALVIFGMKYYAAIQQAKAREAEDASYRELAAKVLATQGEAANALASLSESLAGIDTRLAAVEKILKDVE